MDKIDIPGGRGRHWASMDERDMAALGPIDLDVPDSLGTPSASHTSVSGKERYVSYGQLLYWIFCYN